MPIIKDDSIVLRKYYPIADIVIVVSFVVANIFVVMQIFGSNFLTEWASEVTVDNVAATKFLKTYPGFYFIFQNFCYPAFWVVNNMPHEIASWLSEILEEFRHVYPDIAYTFGITAMQKHVAKFANSHPNLVLQFFDNKLYVYAIGEFIISASALIYGLITRLIAKISHHLIG